MKKIISFILLICMALSLSSCGNPEITMQEIYEAGQIENMLKNHKSIYIQDEMEGKIFCEKYLTEEYVYEYYPDEEFDFAQFMTDDANYAYSSGDYLRYLFIAPDGVTNDFSNDRAERYDFVLTENIAEETIESVSKKDGQIIVNGVLSEEAIAKLTEEGLTSGKTEYTLDAKTNELISVVADYAYEDGTIHVVTEVAYDAEAPEMIDVFMEYANQTEDLRNVTVITNPGTEKEISQNFQIPKGLIVGLTWDDAFENKVELFADAACTEGYDPYVNTDSDITICIRWNE